MSGENVVKLDYPGLIQSLMPSGNTRYLVRVEGDVRKRITLTVTPEHEEFHTIYMAARRGVRLEPSLKITTADTGTLAWLSSMYLDHLEIEAKNGNMSPLTLKQREHLMPVFLKHISTSQLSHGKMYAELPVEVPSHELIKFRDSLMATPAKAKNTFKMLKAMYSWAYDRGYCKTNPAAAIKVAYVSKGGATPWTVEDLKKYRNCHHSGTMAHLCLTLFMFTACRISDAYLLGRKHEKSIQGVKWLEWEPTKKGSKTVSIPILTPLESAIRSQIIAGDTYLLTKRGKPFSSSESLRNKLKDWCIEAGLPNLSSHGIRKAAGHLLAQNGASQYEIMAIHGHSNASTSEIYTKDVERQNLASSAAKKMKYIDW